MTERMRTTRRRTARAAEPPPSLDFEEVTVAAQGGLGYLLHTQHRPDMASTEVRMGVPDARLHQSCVYFVVPDAPSEPIALQWVGYNPACSRPDLPERGGTAGMLGAALRVLWARYPNPEVRFMDTSELLRCHPEPPRAASDAEGLPAAAAAPHAVSLAYHSVLLYGRTWYQRHFAARPLAPAHRPRAEPPEAALARAARELAAPPPGPGGFEPWFDAHVGGPARPAFSPLWRWLHGPIVKGRMRQAWERQPASWSAFFREVNEACGCAVFAVLNDTFARGALGLDMGAWEWAIARPELAAGALTQSGGGLVVRPAGRRLARAGAAFFAAMDRVRMRTPLRHGHAAQRRARAPLTRA